MKVSTTRSAIPARAREHGAARPGLLLAILALAVFAAIGFEYYRAAQARKTAAQSTAGNLSSSTSTVLNELKSPVEIRFYALLDPRSTSESMRAFAGRVDQLLAEYERAGNGKIHVTRINEINDANSEAAAADGIHGFNRDKGDTCYLGIAAERNGQKETMAELSPDWEQALEPDLSRVVQRVNEMTPPGAAPANVSDSEIAAAQKAIAANPNLATATLDEGKQILRDDALTQFKAAVTDMQNQIAAVEDQVKQGTLSAADAGKQIEQIRATQTAKIQQITGQFHDQTAAFAQSKAKTR